MRDRERSAIRPFERLKAHRRRAPVSAGSQHASANPLAGWQREFQLPNAPCPSDFQSACVRTIEQGSSSTLCLQLEAAWSCLNEDDVISRGDLKRLPDADGERDPSSGLNDGSSLHWLGLTGSR